MMKIKIIGKVPSGITPSDFVKFMEFKDCPGVYLSLPWVAAWKDLAWKYGVRWDLMLCQSILETGCFKFEGSSVKPEYHNYAGIGATDTNPEPERYTLPSAGIEAQAQILAIRAGVKVGRENMISERYKKYYDLVFDKAHYWHLLAGTWASDLKYWEKIQKLAHEFEVVTGKKILIEEEGMTRQYSWCKLFGDEKGAPFLVRYGADATTVEGREFIENADIDHLIKELQIAKNGGAGTVRIAHSTEPLPDVAHTDPVQPIPAKRIKILLDPGHSKSDPGAISPNKKVKEYALNLAQAEIIKEQLPSRYYQVDIYDPNPDNLGDVGNHAKGYDLFISLHHNSYSGTGEPGVEVFTVRNPDKTSKALAENICFEIAEHLEIPNRGHKEKNYTVIEVASKHCPAVLVESHFVSDETDLQKALDKSEEAALAICRAVNDNSSMVKPIEPQPEPENSPVWSGIKVFKKGANIQLTRNFTSNEFDCKCSKCNETKIDYLQLQRLQELRDHMGMPIVIHSGYRCEHHNAAVGGAAQSQHMEGRATDFSCKGVAIKNTKLMSKIYELWENGGIGTYSSFWHTDTWHKRRWG